MIARVRAPEIDNATKAKGTQMRDAKRDAFCDIRESVAAGIAGGRRVGQLTAADTVEDDQDDARKGSQVRDVSMVAMACLNAM